MRDIIANMFGTGENIVFILLSVLIISGAVLMISHTRLVQMVVSLAFVFLGLAGIYVLLEAEFVAFVQVLIYAGAVTILMVFGITMTRRDTEETQPHRPWHNALLLIGVLFWRALFQHPAREFSRGRVQPRGRQHDGDRRAVVHQTCHSV